MTVQARESDDARKRARRGLAGERGSERPSYQGSDSRAAASPPAAAGAELPRLRSWMPLAVVLVGLATTARALSGELVYDDLLLVKQNPGIRSLAGIGDAFGAGYWDFLGPLDAQRIGYFRPLSRVALTVGWALGGGAPLAFHALSIGLHLLASLAVLFVARRLLRSSAAALFAALVFCAHPLQVESVAWISALNDPLYGLFALLALLAHLRWRDGGSRGVALLPSLFLLLAALSKEHGLVVPLLLLAADVARDRPLLARWQPFLRAYAPVAAVGLAYCLWRMRVFGDWRAGFDRETTDFGITAGRQLSLRVEMLGGWLGLLVWPARLSLFRSVRPELQGGDAALITANAALLAAVAIGAWLAWRRERRLLAALLLVPAALSPGLVRLESLGLFPLSDRFAYVAVAGFALLLAGLGARHLPRLAAVALAGLAVAGLGARSFARIGDWRDEETLFRTHVELEPRSVYARWGLGRVLLGSFQRGGATDAALLQEALRAFESAQDLLDESKREGTDVLATNEDFLQTHLGVAWSHVFAAALDGFGDYSTPLTLFQMVVDRLPYDERAWIGIGLCHHRQDDLPAAENAYKQALKRNPASAEAHRNYGQLLVDMRDLRRARYHFEQSMARRGENLQDLLDVARCWQDEGWPAEAEQAALRARELAPGAVEPLLVLATVDVTRSDSAAALRWLDQALALDGGNGGAWLLRAKVLSVAGETAEAIVSFRRACELMPSSFEAHYSLGRLLIQSGAPDGALPYLDRAYRVGTPDRALMAALREQLAALLATDAARLLALSRADSGRNDLDGAWRFAELAREDDPSDPGVIVQRSALLRAQGRSEEALADLEVLAATRPESFDAALELGLLYRLLGRPMDAREQLRRALELLPESAPAEIRAPLEKLIAELGAQIGD